MIGNNATALAAATQKAIELGYEARSLGSEQQGFARDVGRDLAQLGRSMRDANSPPVPGPVF